MMIIWLTPAGVYGQESITAANVDRSGSIGQELKVLIDKLDRSIHLLTNDQYLQLLIKINQAMETMPETSDDTKRLLSRTVLNSYGLRYCEEDPKVFSEVQSILMKAGKIGMEEVMKTCIGWKQAGEGREGGRW